MRSSAKIDSCLMADYLNQQDSYMFIMCLFHSRRLFAHSKNTSEATSVSGIFIIYKAAFTFLRKNRAKVGKGQFPETWDTKVSAVFIRRW